MEENGRLVVLTVGGVTDRLIPLFAVGAFLAFTLSQAGMVAHWHRKRGVRALHSMLVNGVGAVSTATTVMVVTVSKFAEGAWVTTLLIGPRSTARTSSWRGLLANHAGIFDRPWTDVFLALTRPGTVDVVSSSAVNVDFAP